MGKKANLAKTIGLASAITLSWVSCDSIKNITKQYLKEDLTEVSSIKQEEQKINQIFNYWKKTIFNSESVEFKNKSIEEDLDVIYNILTKDTSLNLTIVWYHWWWDAKISKWRAESVKKYLVWKWINSDRIDTEWSDKRMAQSIEIRIGNWSKLKKIDPKEIDKRHKELQNKQLVGWVDRKDYDNNIRKIAESPDASIIVSLQTWRHFMKIWEDVYYNSQWYEDEIWWEASNLEDSFLRIKGSIFVKITKYNTHLWPNKEWYVMYEWKYYNDKWEEVEIK